MATTFISQDDFDDFMEECDTDPFILLTVEKQINSATSLVSFAAAARAKAPANEPTHWTEQLLNELESTSSDPVDAYDAMVEV